MMDLSFSVYRLVAYKYKQLFFARLSASGDDKGLLFNSLKHESTYVAQVFQKGGSLNVYQKAVFSIYNRLQIALLEKTEKILKERSSQLQLHLIKKNSNLSN